TLHEPEAGRVLHRDDVSDAGRVGAVNMPDDSLSVGERDDTRNGGGHAPGIPGLLHGKPSLTPRRRALSADRYARSAQLDTTIRRHAPTLSADDADGPTNGERVAVEEGKAAPDFALTSDAGET